jgi:Domain of unknown function (DUF4157)
MTGHDTPEPTLGERLDAVARAMAQRHHMRYPWADSLIPVLRRAARLSESAAGRFERHEVPEGPQLPARPEGADRGPWPAPPAAAGYAPRPARPAAPPSPGRDAEVSNPAEDLPADVRAQLADVAGPGADLLRVRTGPAADSVSRAYRADAVTTGADVWFRAGRFRPREPAGLALLAHEAAHVSALLDPGRSWRRASAGGAGQEEDAALAAEATALRRFGQPPGGPATTTGPAPGHPAAVPAAVPPAQPHPPPGPADPAGSSPAAAAAARPMPASADREIGPPPPFDVEQLRRSLLTELMRQLRSDFERGG